MALIPIRNPSDKDAQIRLLHPNRFENIDHTFGRNRAGHDLVDSMVELVLTPIGPVSHISDTMTTTKV